MRAHTAWILVAIATFLVTLSQASNPCLGDDAQKSCGACIATHEGCGWCTAEETGENLPRCNLVEKHTGKCDPSFIVSPTDSIRKIQDNPVTDGDVPENAVQIQPQNVDIRIRPNKPFHLKVTFRQAENYPVDLYYLMDLSNSMEDDKEKLAELGNLIAASMSRITKNFRLGFGSFVDKVVMPYVSTIPSKQRVPCHTRTGRECEAPYGFRNQLSLNLDTTLFARQVNASSVSGNLDAPEGGFDAIMQAVVCDEIGWRKISRRMLLFSTDAGFHYAGDGKSIGWRSQSRKMLLFSTDAGFHYAGDGKLGGIVKPNDGHCHLQNGVYTMSSYQDYPSVSQIASVIRDKQVNIIFAVTSDQKPVYDLLSNHIEGSVAGELANDSSNIVNLVRENYKKITSKVIMNTKKAENITVKFFSKCFGNDVRETNECEGLGIGQNVTFDVEVTVTQCPADRAKWKRDFVIYPVGLAENITVTLNLICECDCEKPEHEERNSPLCSNGNGTFECGKCTCNKNRYGKLCECDEKKVSSEESDAKCMPNGTNAQLCSGRGDCVCGVCQCKTRNPNTAQRYSGPFCECDNFACDYFQGQLCGGPSRGVCDCGKCKCFANFSGNACDCPTSKETCLAAPDSTGKRLLCNGVGECKCGRCDCAKESMFRGPTCEDCPTCPGKCRENQQCVLCRAFRSGTYSTDECEAKCSTKRIQMVSEARETEVAKLCKFKDEEDDCFFYFTYEYDVDGDLQIKVQQTKVCPESVNVLAIVGGVVSGIVAVGLALLLIWKLLTIIHDRREFAKFEKERQNAKWDTGENPIYKQATSTFKNPTYAGRQ